MGDAALHDIVVEWLIDASPVHPCLSAPNVIETVERVREGPRLLSQLNHPAEV